MADTPEPSPTPADRASASKVTIHDVAAAAGVSIKTVSRVVRGEPGASEATREAVRKAIAALQYTPHLLASALSSHVTPVLGLVSGLLADHAVARAGHEFRMAFQTGALEACVAHSVGLSIVRMTAGDPLQRAEHLVQRVRRREMGAYLLPTPVCDIPGLLDHLDAAGVPYGTVNPQHERPHVPSVSSDDRAAMRGLAQQVLSLGHRRIGLILGNQGWRDTDERHAGFMDAMADAGLRVDPHLVHQGAFTFDAGQQGARRLLALPRRPTAIMGCSDDIAAGVIAEAYAQGLNVPTDLSVTGYDDLDMARKLWPALSTVRQPIERMAEIAALQVIGVMMPNRDRAGLPPSRVRLHSDIVMRMSLTAPKI